MKTTILIRLFLLFLFLLFLTSCIDPPPGVHGDLVVSVMDDFTGSALEYALISISMEMNDGSCCNYDKYSDANGNAYFRNLDPGDYQVIITHEQYFDIAGEVDVDGSEINATNPFLMKKKPVLAISAGELNIWPEQDTAYLILSNATTGVLYYFF